MLSDAAILTLEVARLSWDAGFHLRDASAFNVLFTDNGPRFIDLGSFRPGYTPYWFAFGQFCDHFLNPLVLASLGGGEARWAWQLGLEGMSASELRRLLGRRLFRRGVFSNVWLRAALEARNASMSEAERSQLRSGAGLPPEAVADRFSRLQHLVRHLPVPDRQGWAGYQDNCTYTESQATAKLEFLESVAARHGGALAIDVGANTGVYSQILSKHYRNVAALENDESALDRMYRGQQAGKIAGNVRLVLADILNPSGGRGVLGRERPDLISRFGSADLVCWLAVLHHLVISANLPLSLFAELAASMGRRHVVEHVSPDDPMARLLSSGRPEAPWPFDVETFEQTMGEHFETEARLDVSDTRRLYALRQR
jgi:hypothetical protein